MFNLDVPAVPVHLMSQFFQFNFCLPFERFQGLTCHAIKISSLPARVLLVVSPVPYFPTPAAQRTMRPLFTWATTAPVWVGNSCDFIRRVKGLDEPFPQQTWPRTRVFLFLDGFRPRIKSPICPNLIYHR